MYSTNFKIYNDALHESNFKEKEKLHFVIPVPKNNNENLFIYLFIYLFILYLQLTNLQLKTDVILYTNKNSHISIIIKKHANSHQIFNENFLKLKS